MMRAYIISIGDELMNGEIINTCAAYISKELIKRGITTNAILILPDSIDIAVKYIKIMMKDEGIFIFTGGLGATRDDVTRKILSEVLKRKLCIDDEKANFLRQWYKEKGRTFTEADRLQAAFPEGGLLLDNSIGLAPGFYIQNRKQYIFSLPGVPKEMEYMFMNEVIPRLQQHSLIDQRYNHEILLFSNIPEYTLDHRVHDIVTNFEAVRYGTRAMDGIIRVRIESENTDITPCVSACIDSLNDYFISKGEKSIETVIGDLLVQKGLTIAVAESCTAGFFSKRITDVSGSSRYFVGGIVSYSNEIKKNILGVADRTLKKYGAVSKQTAQEMARGVQKRFAAEITISITGIAGPDGGSEEKPVGTVYICLYRPPDKVIIDKNVFPGDREGIRRRSVNKAFFILQKYLKGLN
jgi:nicotinamide-nucleotide amidase